jgi:hypothetical protein
VLALGAPIAAAAGTPQIPESWVTDVTATSANMHAKIDPGGLSTTYRFEYLTVAAYEANLNAVPPREGFVGAAKQPPSGSTSLGSTMAAVLVARHAGSLASTTTYRYRPVATNSEGTTVGPEHVFTTQVPTNVSHFADNRAWELVSPTDKGGGAGSALWRWGPAGRCRRRCPHL